MSGLLKSSVASALLAVFLAAQGAALSQIDVTGTWSGANGWSSYFRQVDGKIVGVVSHCGTVLSRVTDIEDARIDGSTFTFKCSAPNQSRVIAFSGQVSADAIDFTWKEVERRPGVEPNALDKILGPSSPTRFTVRRTKDGELAKTASETPGSEFTTAASIPQKNTRADALLFIPERVRRVRALVVIFRYGVGTNLHSLPEWRKLPETIEGAVLAIRYDTIGPRRSGFNGIDMASGGADALLKVIERAALDSGRPEITTAPWIIWGHSAGGGAASLLAATHPNRVLGFVRYHSGPVTGDLAVVSTLPSLLVSAENDPVAPPELGEPLWKRGRALNGPWTYALNAGADHGDLGSRASQFMLDWIAAVVRHRLPSDAAAMQPVTLRSGWLGDLATGLIAPADKFEGSAANASWFPDEASARAWRDFVGGSKK